MNGIGEFPDLQEYLTEGVERIVSDAVRATLQNPRESAFMLKFAAASKSASKRRRKLEDAGEHVPSFLIASITSKCNLHCAGCYSRCNHATVDADPVSQLTGGEWSRIFDEADALGISFILLAGGEPMLRRDVIEAAGEKRNILFPIFTNGTFMDERYFDLFDRCRNLLPVMSIEGNREITDARRGKGIYDRLIANMEEMDRRGLIFGASVTATRENIREAASWDFLKSLSDRGCKAVIFVEYVPSRRKAGIWLREMKNGNIWRGRSTSCGGSVPKWSMSPSPGTKKHPAAVWRQGAASSTSTPTAERNPVPSPRIRISTSETLLSGKPFIRRCLQPSSTGAF